MLFVTHHARESQPKLGLSIFLDRTFTEKFNEKKPMEGIYSSDWHRYNRHKHGVPVPEQMQLPPKLLMVCKGLKRFQADFFSQHATEWIVSERFFTFLQQRHLLEGQYEQSELTVVSTSNKSITEQPYFLLRLNANANALVDFEKTPTIISPVKPLTKHTPPTVYYPELIFQAGVQPPALFYLDNPSYRYSFFCTEHVKAEMQQEKFLGFDFYTLEEYAQECLFREQYPLGMPSERSKPLP